MITQVLEPYGDYNNIFEFNLESLDNKPPYIALKIKLFLIAMIYQYKKLGLDCISNELTLSNFPASDENSINYFNFIEEYEINGAMILHSLETMGWIYESNIISASDILSYSSLGNTADNDLLSDESFLLVSPLIKYFRNIDINDNSYDLAYYRNDKLGCYMNYVKTTNRTSSYHNQILSLIDLLSNPFIYFYPDHSVHGLIGTTYYIAFLEGTKFLEFNYPYTNVNMYLPLYAHYLENYLNLSFQELNIKEDRIC